MKRTPMTMRGAEALRAEFRPVALERVRRALVLGKLQEQEGVTISPEDVAAELDRIGSGGPQGEQLRQIFDTESGREAIERTLASRRTIERLRQIARGEAPEREPEQASDVTLTDSEASEAVPDTERQEETSSATPTPTIE